jgi:hypothetical protein
LYEANCLRGHRESSLAASRAVRFTLKARRELGRVVAEGTGEWMYVFKPRVATLVVYIA